MTKHPDSRPCVPCVPYVPITATPEVTDSIRRRIAAVCHRIDRRLGNSPGTAERGTYFWLFPPTDITDEDVLTNLHTDAVQFLFDITHPKENRP